ncbi:MAG: cytochrome c oxidase subunit II [Methylocystis sp.]|nr:cytochrome c oxidase subunit II [Methylocystis sp.]MBI3274482.1 cytochrome c oxidase subunit II [Methylocystis sp.]
MLTANRHIIRRAAPTAGALFLVFWFAGVAAAGAVGQPEAGGVGLPVMVTPVGQETQAFYNGVLLPIISFIALFVFALLVYVGWRFNEQTNPVPSKLTHHTGLEITWTLIPVLILLFISIPSFRLLAHQVEIPDAKVTIKATGNQWYWSYRYPEDQGGFAFDSMMKPEADLKPGDLRLLAVDNEVVVPVNEVVKVQVVTNDVIHSFAVPAFGVRIDAIPGRLNETWFKAETEGVYYGSCTNICGKDHAFMPIAVRVVSHEKYDEWLAEATVKFAKADAPLHVAADQARR